MNILLRRPVLLVAFWLLLAVLTALALLPGNLPLPTTGWDKANHVLAFVALGGLGLLCWPLRSLSVLAALAFYGAAIEVAQSFTPTRSADWHDLVADVVGLALAYALLRARARARERLQAGPRE